MITAAVIASELMYWALKRWRDFITMESDAENAELGAAMVALGDEPGNYLWEPEDLMNAGMVDELEAGMEEDPDSEAEDGLGAEAVNMPQGAEPIRRSLRHFNAKAGGFRGSVYLQ